MTRADAARVTHGDAAWELIAALAVVKDGEKSLLAKANRHRKGLKKLREELWQLREAIRQIEADAATVMQRKEEG